MPSDVYANLTKNSYDEVTVKTIVNPIQPSKTNAQYAKKIEKAKHKFESINPQVNKTHIFAVEVLSNGQSIAQLYCTSSHDNDVFSLDYLHVAEEFRNKTIGTHLYKMALSKAINMGKKIIELDTHTFQSPDFYTKFDFKQVGNVRYQVSERSALLFFEKDISNEKLGEDDELPDFSYQIFEDSYTYNYELFEERLANIHQIYLRAVEGVMQFTVKRLSEIDDKERDLPDYTISIKKGDTLVGYSAGCMNVDYSPSGSLIRPYKIWAEEEKYLEILSQSLLKMGREYYCREVKVTSTFKNTLDTLKKMPTLTSEMPVKELIYSKEPLKYHDGYIVES